MGYLRLKYKKGESLLMGNLVFIILVAVFFGILILFLVSRMNSFSIYEQRYAKIIALALDYAEPGTVVWVNMDSISERLANSPEKELLSQSVSIQGNIVNVKFTQDSKGYSYAFFNDVKISEKDYYYSPVENVYVFQIKEEVANG